MFLTPPPPVHRPPYQPTLQRTHRAASNGVRCLPCDPLPLPAEGWSWLSSKWTIRPQASSPSCVACPRLALLPEENTASPEGTPREITPVSRVGWLPAPVDTTESIDARAPPTRRHSREGLGFGGVRHVQPAPRQPWHALPAVLLDPHWPVFPTVSAPVQHPPWSLSVLPELIYRRSSLSLSLTHLVQLKFDGGGALPGREQISVRLLQSLAQPCRLLLCRLSDERGCSHTGLAGVAGHVTDTWTVATTDRLHPLGAAPAGAIRS